MRLATRLSCAAIVLIPLGVIASLGPVRDYKVVSASFDLDVLRTGIQRWSDSRHRLPSEAEGLEVLENGSDPALDHVPTDPWHHAYVYRLTAERPGFIVYSAGLDGVDDRGAGDDVTTGTSRIAARPTTTNAQAVGRGGARSRC